MVYKLCKISTIKEAECEHLCVCMCMTRVYLANSAWVYVDHVRTFELIWYCLFQKNLRDNIIQTSVWTNPKYTWTAENFLLYLPLQSNPVHSRARGKVAPGERERFAPPHGARWSGLTLTQTKRKLSHVQCGVGGDTLTCGARVAFVT